MQGNLIKLVNPRRIFGSFSNGLKHILGVSKTEGNGMSDSQLKRCVPIPPRQLIHFTALIYLIY